MTEALTWRAARRHPSAAFAGMLATDWLTDGERETLAGLQAQRRREEWLLGRWLAKKLILDQARVTPITPAPLGECDVEIFSLDGLGRRTRPRIMIGGLAQSWSLSIAHSEDLVLVALSTHPRVSVGVDVVAVQSWTNSSLEMWFTTAERRWIETGAARPSTLWAIKEASYKAVNQGEPFVPRKIEVRPEPDGGYGYMWHGVRTTVGHEIRVGESREQVIVMALASHS